MKDKKMKMEALEELMKKMGSEVAERDLKPKSKLIIQAEGDDPEQMKEDVIDKLQGMKLPNAKEMKDIEKKVKKGSKDDDDYISEMTPSMQEKMRKNKKS